MSEFVKDYLSVAGRHYRSDDGLPHMRAAAEELVSGLNQLMAQTTTGTDEQGEVTATVTLGGRLTDLRISAYAMSRLDAGGLSLACTAAVRAARAAAGAQFREAIGEAPAEWAQLDPAEFLRRGRL
jgi:DNA-binding protein YbaB